MTRRRWIADEASDEHAALIGAHAEHLIRVLRAQVGEEFDVVADGIVRRGRVSKIVDGRVEFELGEEILSEKAADVSLVLAVFKFDRLEWAIEKCTELGVSRIVPAISRRTDAHLASASAKRVERWRKIAKQAAEQSRRCSAPEISAPQRLREAVLLPATLRIVLSESERAADLKGVIPSAQGSAILAVGPEGGWTEDELEMFRKERWMSASLGPTILRAETAAIAATAIVMSELQG